MGQEEPLVEYDLFVIPVNEAVKHAKTFAQKTEALLAFNAVVNDGKMRAVFLDERQNFPNKTHSCFNIKLWRKRKHVNTAKGQSG